MTKDFDYLALSARTNSAQFNGDLVSLKTFYDTLENFIRASVALDRVKKLLFYGTDPSKGRFPDARYGDERANVARETLGGPEAANIIHGILGVATEAGELCEMLLKATRDEERPDMLNLFEETGDVKWYLAMLSRAQGIDWDTDERANIDKLKKRYPDKFTSEAANNRDIDAEREALEGSPWPKSLRPVSDMHRHEPAAHELEE